MAKSDTTLSQIVRGELQGDAIAGQHTDPVAAQPPGQMRQDHVRVVFKLHAEKTTGKLL